MREKRGFKTIQAAFADRVGRCPDAIAVAAGEQVLTYWDLDAQSTQLARYLRRRGIGVKSVVGVRMEGPALIVALLGILKCGAAYLPLDPAAPEDRLEWILEDAGAKIVLGQQKQGDRAPVRREMTIYESIAPQVACELTVPLLLEDDPEALAYVMYTSGSTGRPKGVAIPHTGVIGLVLDTNYISLERGDRVAQISNVAFDAATFEIWGALLNGAQLVMLERDTLLSPRNLERELQAHGITTLFLTTSIFHQAASEAPAIFRGLTTLVVGGEACDARAAAKVLRHGPPQRLLNGYGPTECTTFALFHEVRNLAASSRTVPIGTPISGTEALLLDSQLKRVAKGEAGEIYLGGPRLARGYFNNEELTRERFIVHPFSEGARLYRTGDLARELPDGAWEFMGRADQQVKLNGYRIEPGEIEAALGTHPGIDQRMVMLLGETSEEHRLAAYLTATGRDRATPAELRNYLGKRLPDYMIPAAFVWLNRFPLTANGKVDTNALRALDIECERDQSHFRAPETPTERVLAGIWEEALHVRGVGRDDNFFNLGGRSIIAARIFSKIRERFGKALPHGSLLQDPTLRGLAATIDGERPISPLVKIRRGSPDLPLFLVHGGPGGVFQFRALAAHMGPNRTIYGIEAPWLSRRQERHWTMEELAALYVQEIRKVQPQGPYHLGGYSQGGSIAFEMAQQLRRQGEEIASLLLLDAFNSHGGRRLSYKRRIAMNFGNLKGMDWSKKIHSIASRTWGKANGMLTLRLAAVPFTRKPLTTRLRPSDFASAQVELLRQYRPQVYAGAITLFLGEQLGEGFGFEYDLTYGWEGIAAEGLQVLRSPGTHYTILDEPHVRTLAQKVALCLKDKP